MRGRIATNSGAPGSPAPGPLAAESCGPPARPPAALGAGTARGVKVDFLWIIDNSPSMADKQATLSAAADNIASQLANASCSMDWRMAVAYTDAQVAPSSNDVCSGSPGPGRRRVCP